MIGLSKRAVVEGISSISKDWVGFAFSGPIPTKESLMPFDPKDDAQLYSNSCAAFEMSSTLRGDHVKFYGVGGVVPYKGVSDISVALGYKVTPNVVNTNLDFKLFDRLMLVSGQLGLSETVPSDSFVEYQFDPCRISSVVVEARGNINGEVEYHDGSDWVPLLTVTSSPSVLNIPGPDVDAYGIRIRSTESVRWTLDALDVYAEGQSSNASIKNPISWVILLPLTAVGLGSVADKDYPYLYLPVGGPNSEEPMMLNTITPDYGQEVKLLYFTLGSGLMTF